MSILLINQINIKDEEKMARNTMALAFSVKENKYKPTRINVHCNQTGQHVGSFTLEIQAPEEFSEWKELDEQQQYEFQLYFYNLKYLADDLNVKAIDSENFRLLLSAPLIEALKQLSKEAKRQKIIFNPINAMLNGMLNYCRNVEVKLKKKNKTFSALEYAGVELVSKQTEYKKQNEDSLKLIFSALSKIYNKHDKLLTYAAYFDKDKTISDNAIKLISEGKSKAASWMVSCALMVLGEEGDKSIKSLPRVDFLSLWLMPLVRIKFVKNSKHAKKLCQDCFGIKITDEELQSYFEK